MTKYHSKKTTVDNIIFDSAKEANRYLELKLLLRAGEIKDLVLQQDFELQPSYKKGQKKVAAIKYIADFTYYDIREEKQVIEDVKGFKTAMYLVKKKMFEYKYPELEIIEV